MASNNITVQKGLFLYKFWSSNTLRTTSDSMTMNSFLSFFIRQSSVSAVANQLLLPSTLRFDTHVAPPSHSVLPPFIATNWAYTLLTLPTRVIWRLIAFNTCVFVVWDEFGSCDDGIIIVVTCFPPTCQRRIIVVTSFPLSCHPVFFPKYSDFLGCFRTLFLTSLVFTSLQTLSSLMTNKT